MHGRQTGGIRGIGTSEDRPIINRPIIPPPWVLDRGAIREGGAPPYFGEGGL